MKMQIKNSQWATIAITFLATLLIMAACNERKEPVVNTVVSTPGVKPPKLDIDTAVLTEKSETIKQQNAGGSNLIESDPLGGLSQLISVSLFGYMYGFFHFL